METNIISNRLLFLIYRVAVNIIALGFASVVFKHVTVSNFGILVFAALILTLLNILIKSFLSIFSLPFILLTFGIGYLIINPLIIILMAWAVKGYNIDGLWTAIGVSLVVSIVNIAFDVFAQSRAN